MGCEVWEVGDGEQVAGDGGQKPWWEVELERD